MTKERFIERVRYYLSDEYMEENSKIAAEAGCKLHPSWYVKDHAYDIIKSLLEEVE